MSPPEFDFRIKINAENASEAAEIARHISQTPGVEDIREMFEMEGEDDKRLFKPDRLAFGGYLAFLRIQKGMLQRDLAGKLQVNGSTISLWEKGKRVPRQRLQVDKI